MMAAGHVAEADVQRNARIIGEQSTRMVQALKNVVGFVRRESMSATTVDIGAIARTSAKVSNTIARARGAEIQLDIDGVPAQLRGNADSLLVAVMHLVDNALRASANGGTVTLRLREESIPNGDDPDAPARAFWRLDVEDRGSGIPPSVRERLFQPFNTSRRADEGTGMGLFLAQAIAKDHGGWIEGHDNADVGARFTLHLPRGQANAK
jgi:signal transduction histidine kinase